jgi:hypothetical protein
LPLFTVMGDAASQYTFLTPMCPSFGSKEYQEGTIYIWVCILYFNYKVPGSRFLQPLILASSHSGQNTCSYLTLVSYSSFDVVLSTASGLVSLVILTSSNACCGVYFRSCDVFVPCICNVLVEQLCKRHVVILKVLPAKSWVSLWYCSYSTDVLSDIASNVSKTLSMGLPVCYTTGEVEEHVCSWCK